MDETGSKVCKFCERNQLTAAPYCKTMGGSMRCGHVWEELPTTVEAGQALLAALKMWRDLAAEGYNLRPAECEQIDEAIRRGRLVLGGK